VCPCDVSWRLSSTVRGRCAGCFHLALRRSVRPGREPQVHGLAPTLPGDRSPGRAKDGCDGLAAIGPVRASPEQLPALDFLCGRTEGSEGATRSLPEPDTGGEYLVRDLYSGSVVAYRAPHLPAGMVVSPGETKHRTRARSASPEDRPSGAATLKLDRAQTACALPPCLAVCEERGGADFSHAHAQSCRVGRLKGTRTSGFSKTRSPLCIRGYGAIQPGRERNGRR